VGLEGLHHLGVEEAVALVGADPVRGLRSEEATRRLRAHGPNALPAARRRGPWRRLAAQFRNPLIYVLMAAAAITVAIGRPVDSAVIAGVVIVNAVIGYVQEARAEQALTALLSVARTRAVVVRDGRRRVVDSDVLVPGDLIHLEAGDRVPADVRLSWVRQVRVDESMLTGESVPVDKEAEPVPHDAVMAERASMCYAGTLVMTGRAQAIVVATGPDTELGHIHRLVSEAADLATPLTRRLDRFAGVLTVAILALAALAFTLGLARGESGSEMFTAAVALAVGAIPEGLPAAVTIALAIGVGAMARRRAIVRYLPAAETLGSTTVICSDKTGTLTRNRMAVQVVWACGRSSEISAGGAGDAVVPCLVAGVLCNDARLGEEGDAGTAIGDPTETALLEAAAAAGLSIADLRGRHPRLDLLPFASERRWMATVNATPDGPVLYAKGAVERILDRTTTMLGPDGVVPLDRDLVLAEAAALADDGLRVLAFATGAVSEAGRIEEDSVHGLTLVGLQGMFDPPRPEAMQAVAECRRAGIAVKMVTGDQLETARAIARRIGLGRGAQPVAITGAELARTDPHELPDLVDATDVFARVSPEQKLRLVEGLQARGHVVAMTGDGVNDAPALRQADLGIAMGRGGTEVAREAADMILADDDFATIAAAVEEGRRVFDNITKFIVWTLPTNFGEGLVILVAIVLGTTLPILPTQILWINMTTAVALGLMLAFERLEDEAMVRPPRDPAAPLLGRALVERMALVSTLLLAGAYGLFELELHLGTPMDQARTVAANVFVVGEAFYLLNCRSLERSFVSVGVFSNRWVLLGLASTVALQLLFTYAPFMQALFDTEGLSPASWARIVMVGAAISLVVGAEKLVRRRLQRAGDRGRAVIPPAATP
jgi:cation-transporting P-type ATPase F